MAWLQRCFRAAVNSLTATILEMHAGPAAAAQHTPAVARFVLDQHGRMPDYLRWPLLYLTLCFVASTILFRGRTFLSAELSTRQRQVTAWKHSRLGPCRDLIKFHETLIVFGYQAELAEQVGIDSTTTEPLVGS